MSYEIFQYLMIFFYLIAAVLALASVLLFFKLNIKDVFIRLSNKAEDTEEMPVAENSVVAMNTVDTMAQQQNLTAMLDNKGRTVLLDEPVSKPAAPVAAAAKRPKPNANPNFRVLKSVINIDTNEVI